MNKVISRRTFIGGGAVLGASALATLSGCSPFSKSGDGSEYNVVILGDTHYDTEPDSVYHSHYDEKVEWLNRVQRQEFARNGEMWRERCPRMLSRAGANIDSKTVFTLQMGDLIQGDCMDPETHRKMLDDVMNNFKGQLQNKPIVTVVGNHDIRGYDKDGEYGPRVYAEYMTDRMSKELGQKVEKTTFSFWKGKDVWIVVDFNDPDLEEIKKQLDKSSDARYTFFVTHGPVFPYDSASCRWFLLGKSEQTEKRKELRSILAKRNVIVLCGHTHMLEYADWFGDGGNITQFTMNSVWSKEELDKPEYDSTTPDEYGSLRRGKINDDGTPVKDETALFDEYRPGLKTYQHAKAAGSFKLFVSDKSVKIDFFGGDSEAVTQSWMLREK
ncbi:MAG: metallophosphoesterase [Coriobacteriia bacterium]|nr:metallophosphoesterase [Coriobacteriia bacterium]